MKFERYSSIENSYRIKTIQYMEINLPTQQYFVQEKVHGSNFAFYFDGTTIQCSKRSGFIGPEENFFNHQKVLSRYENNILDLYNILKTAGKEFEVLRVCGEIYGGNYPHPEVANLNDISAVQKGVYYSNDVDFLAFDIKLDDTYLGMVGFNLFCHLSKMPFLPTLKTGTLKECLEYPNEFQTTIPSMRGLPEIEGNICEGVVIRPITPQYFGPTRVILKNKNEKFSEKENNAKTPRVEVDVPENVLSVVKEGLSLVTENRLRNVLSKEGSIGEREFGKLLGLVSKDAIEDLQKDVPEFLELDKKDRKTVTSMINKEVSNLIRPNFLNIIDGTF